MSALTPVLASIISIALGSLGSPTTQQAPQPADTTSSTISADEARQQLDQLSVKGRAPKTGYSRSQFGKQWDDNVDVELGHNNCPTNEDIKARDFTNVTYVHTSPQCEVKSGVLNDPYSGKTINYQRTNGSHDVSIDHVVALSDAWQKGAQKLTAQERLSLANDPRNLVATSHSLNSQKGDGDAATWLPPNKSYRCDYAKKQIEVKNAYKLWVTDAEKDALSRQLDTCTK